MDAKLSVTSLSSVWLASMARRKFEATNQSKCFQGGLKELITKEKNFICDTTVNQSVCQTVEHINFRLKHNKFT